MKVLIRMLASILPGVVVGLGVIAYLERDHLQEEWSALFGSQESTPHETAESEAVVPEVAEEPFSFVPERAESETVVEQTPKKSEPQPVAMTAPATPPSPEEDPARLVEELPALPEPQAESSPAIEAVAQTERDRPEKVAERASPVEAESVTTESTTALSQRRPVLDQVLGLEGGRQGAEQPSPLQQQFDYEVTDGFTPLSPGQVATISKPIEDLAKQFNPLSPSPEDPYGFDAERRRSDVWHVESLEPESQLQWLWNRGRQAFWEGDYELAVESYRSLLQDEPMNPDAWGELGNIYYAKKDWTRAVRAFGRAAAALIHLERLDEAEKILTVIRGIDPALADQLMADLSRQALKKQ